MKIIETKREENILRTGSTHIKLDEKKEFRESYPTYHVSLSSPSSFEGWCITVYGNFPLGSMRSGCTKETASLLLWREKWPRSDKSLVTRRRRNNQLSSKSISKKVPQRTKIDPDQWLNAYLIPGQWCRRHFYIDQFRLQLHWTLLQINHNQ